MQPGDPPFVTELVVHHFGPDPTTVGGMATVIRVFTDHQIGGDVVDSYPTWRPRSHRTAPSLVAASIRALLQMPTTDVAHIHLSEGGSFVREGALVALAHKRGLVTCVTIHGASFLPFARRYPRLASSVLKRAHLITCLDRETLCFVLRNAPAAISELVPNPVSVADDGVPADETDETVVFAGEIGLRKGADVMHRAWQLVAQRRPAARCVMVGPVTDFIPSVTERLEVRAPVGPNEMRAILQRARVIALPSRAEGMPMILVEAMSLGRPFVSTPVGGIPELAAAGGALVAVGDEIGLADRLTELLANGELACTIGNHGRQFCRETRSVDVIDARLRKLYSEAGADKG
jgi:glycosyltransferase involved in cell wall biosynthesis